MQMGREEEAWGWSKDGKGIAVPGERVYKVTEAVTNLTQVQKLLFTIPGGAGDFGRRYGVLALAAVLAWAMPARAAIQFDVFLGYDGVVREASWFPVVCEIKNDGPAFTGVVEVNTANFGADQPRRIVVELPTGTMKRVVVPAFSTARGYSAWDVQLLDEKGRVRVGQKGVQPRKQIGAETTLLGSLPRTAAGAPVLQQILSSQAEMQPASARFQVPIFPDNPLSIEGMDCLYLSSERALDLSVAQVNAILAWLHAGGHLIVGIDQVADISARPWLKDLYPLEVGEMRSLTDMSVLFDWVRGLDSPGVEAGDPPSGLRQRRSSSGSSPFSGLVVDPQFRSADMQVATGKLKPGGEVMVAAGEVPLMVVQRRGFGKVTGLLFSPEREPMRSWRHLPIFWTRLTEVSEQLYVSADFRQAGSWSSDGIFGAMLETRQVNKLPVHWLLLLLIVYLAVIGPIDQYWLKRIGRPMLTWITFPCYVVFFSLLIYFIGYKLRAGESEWNELQLVDVVQGGNTTQFRGRTYASVYAPSNQRYELEAPQKMATFRSEFAGTWGGTPAGDRGSVTQLGDTFRAEVFVPVWASQLVISDWWQPGNSPVEVKLQPAGDDIEVIIANRTGRKLPNSHLAFGEKLIEVGELAAGQKRSVFLGTASGVRIEDFINQHAPMFQNAAQSRRRAFGSQDTRIDDLYQAGMAASFLGQIREQRQGYNPRFLSPPGLDLTAALKDGAMVLFAYDPGATAASPMHKFGAKRQQRGTLWRVAVAGEGQEGGERRKK